MKKLFLALLLVFPMIALAELVDDPPVPLSDVFNDIIELIRNWKGMGTLLIFSSILTIIMQALKTELVGEFFEKFDSGIKRLIIVILGQIQGILMAIVGGLSWWEAIIAGLITSGGAVAIYEVLKPILKKAKINI